MKLLSALVGVVVLSAAAIGVYAQASQPAPYKVVFDLTSRCEQFAPVST